MKKNYEKLSFQIVFLQTDDIITGSKAGFPEDDFWDDEFGEVFWNY